MRVPLLAALLIVIGQAAFADDDIVVGDPNACHLKIAYEAKEQMLHLRPQFPGGADCEVTPLVVQAGLYQALDRHRDAQINLIFLGRLESYPWLSQALFYRTRVNSMGPGFWDEAAGHPADGSSDNEYVANVLSDKVASKCIGELCEHHILTEFEQVLSEQGYRIARVSAEKVLKRYAPPSGDILFIPGGKFPYDALVHLRIEKVP